MNDIVVAKFGGSSLADCNQFRKVKRIINSDKNRRYIVPSAPGKRYEKDNKITDLLYVCQSHAQNGLSFDEFFTIIDNRYLNICEELNINLDLKNELDEIKNKIRHGASADYAASRGEYLNGLVLTSYLNSGCRDDEFQFIDAADIIKFDENGEQNIQATQDLIQKRLANVKYAVIPGFYGSTNDGQIKTFSRGGSDVTGSIIAKCVGADIYENWTDVSGLLMADPRVVENPKLIDEISYKELRELSYMGASVLHENAVFPVRDEGIPINIRNTNSPQDKGTFIVSECSPVDHSRIITGIAGKKDFTVITLEKTYMSGEVGYLEKLLSVFTKNGISIEHIPSGIDSVSVIVSSCALDDKHEIIKQQIEEKCKPDSISIYPNMALVAVVGRGMIKTPGISAKVFGVLGKNDINVRMITQGSSELNIIIGVENDDFERAIQSIYKEFECRDKNLEMNKSCLDSFRRS